MDVFKKRIKRRILFFSAVLLMFVSVLLYNQFGTSNTIKDNLSFSFQCGFSAACALVLVYLITQYRRALSDVQKLQVLYNKENDERTRAIWAKSGIPMTVILSMTLVLAGIVIGYFNETVFVVLICVALFQLLVTGAVKLHYMRKM